MTDLSVTLSAYLDGELDPVEAKAIEQRLASDPEAQQELDALIKANAAAQKQFDAQLTDPVPHDLVQRIKDAPIAPPMVAANINRAPWRALAAGLALFVAGGLGGYMARVQTAPQVVVTAGWIDQVADYHAVYASQKRHLVEVGAEESDHIENWLGNTTGAAFSIPDLSAFDLTFEGGRLLVAAGKPVAQLMYRQPDGTVIALCLLRSDSPTEAEPEFAQRSVNGFDVVSWKAGEAAYVVIGPTENQNLAAIAAAASLEI